MFSKNPLIYLTRKVWKHSAGNRRNVVLYLSLLTSAIGVKSLEPLIVGLFLNTIQTQGISTSNVGSLLLILLLFPLRELLTWMLWGPARVIENRNAFYVRSQYKTHLLKGTINLPIEWHTDHHSGDTIDKIERGTAALFNFSERTFEFLDTGITLAIAIGVLLYFNLLAGFLGIILIVITFFVLILFDKKLVAGYTVVNRMDNSIAAKVFDSLSNVTTIIILRAGTLVLNSLKSAIRKPFQQFDKNSKMNEWKWFTASMLGRAAVLVVVGIYIYAESIRGGVLVGTIYILYSYANEIRETFYRFAYLYNDVVRQRTSVANAEELSNDFIKTELSAPKLLPENWKSISLSNLSFSYHTSGGADLHLDDVSMEIRLGERIAVIGESGGGKSTLLKIIRDLYQPRSINLTVDGKNFGDFSQISDSISLIPQDPEIFNATIRENITIGIDYSDEEIKEFTDAAKFTEVIQRLPQGLESSIVEKGVNLSGGEKQRLALTRGLLISGDKDIILLDEPTSSVDFHNELEIYQNIFKRFKKQTIISAVHRLHLLSLFDKIYFFKEGVIIASGTVDQLRSNSPDFQDLWNQYIKVREGNL